MARPILSEYGPERKIAPAKGTMQGCERDVMNYQPPWGPTNINDTPGAGLHGYNCGNANRPVGSDGSCGSPGLHGRNKGNLGSQRPPR